MERIVLAYSGGLDTSLAIPWLADKYQAEIVTVTMDLGQGKELEDARERALALGAVRAHVLDLRDEFARSFILPSLQAGAVYEERYPLATALGRPLIAKHLVEIAHLEGAIAVAHGCGTEKDNDAARIELGVRALDPALDVLAPLEVWDVTRAEKVAFARKRGIPVPAGADQSVFDGRELVGPVVESGVLDDPWQEPPGDVYALTRSPAEAPDQPAYVEVEFEQGVPVAINGVGHVARRADHQPRDDRQRARHRPHRHAREPSRRDASRARSTRRRRPCCCMPRTASCRSTSRRATWRGSRRTWA